MDHSPHFPTPWIRKYRVLFILVPAILASLLMLVAYLTQYDGPAANYFRRGAALPVTASLFALLSVVGAAVIAFRLPVVKSEVPTVIPASRASYAGAAGFLICAVLQIADIIGSKPTWYGIVTILLLLLSVLYFVYSASAADRTVARDPVILLGIAPVFSSIFLCAIHYFDRSVEMNAPVKVTVLLGLLTAMLAVTGDIRYLIGTAHPRIHLVLLSCSVAAGALVFPAVPFAFFSGAFDHIGYLASSFAVIGCTAMNGIRIVHLLHPADAETEVPQS